MKAVVALCLFALFGAVFAQSGQYCSTCEMLVSFVENWVDDNATMHEMEIFVEKLCMILPSEDQQMCDSFVENYLPQVVEMIEQDFPPEAICAAIGLCTSSAVMSAQQVADTQCTLCEFIAGYVEGWIAQNATEEEIAQGLESICALTPYAQMCDALVQQYLPLIIQWVQNNENPDEVCTQIGLCTSLSVGAVVPKVKLPARMPAITHSIVRLN